MDGDVFGGLTRSAKLPYVSAIRLCTTQSVVLRRVELGGILAA